MPAISAHVSLDISPQTLDDLLCQAAMDGDTEQFRFLVRQGADPFAERWIDEKDYEGNSHRQPRPPLLFYAVDHGHADLVDLLIEMGADVSEMCARRHSWALLNWVQSAQRVPASIAPAAYAHIGHALLEAGADPDFVPEENRRGRRRRGSARWRANEYTIAPALAVLEAFEAKCRAQALSAATAPVQQSAVRKRL